MAGGKSDAHDLSKGDKVSWSWGSQHPSGTVKDVKDGDAEVKTKKGSTISKDGSKQDPVVVIETANGNNAAKNVSSQFPVTHLMHSSVAFDRWLLTSFLMLPCVVVAGERDRQCQALMLVIQ